MKGAADYLAGKRIESPQIAAELLMSRLLGCKRLELPIKHDVALTEKQLEAMRRGTRRLAAGEPVQYILGQTEFMGHVIKTDRRALIPRPETEELVEAVLKCETLWSLEKPAIADIGTGSGCIAISLALAKPAGRYLAVDISEDAISLARENAAAHGLDGKIVFACAELADLIEPQMLDAIVANLPYVTTTEFEQLAVQVRGHEPRAALDGGPDGMSVIETIVQDATVALKPNGRLFLEIGETQAECVKSLLGDIGFRNVEVRRDLAGKDRIVCAEIE